MQELSFFQFDLVRSLYDPIPHSRALVFSVIEGNNPGRVFVDRLGHPSIAVLRFAGGELFLAGRADNEATNREMVALLSTALAPPGSHLIIYTFSDAWGRALDGLLRDRGVGHFVRETFVLDPATFRARHADWRSRVPPGFRVQRMDRDLALRSDPGLAFLWGDIDSFVARALGYCVLREDQIVSRCSPVALGDKRFETGVGTAEAYRRRGLATLACCAFVEHSLDIGLKPEWGCVYNEASKGLATKLGFVPAASVQAHYMPYLKPTARSFGLPGWAIVR